MTALVLAFAIGTSSGTPINVISTPHYDIVVEGMDRKEIAELVENLHATLKAFFHTEPQDRLSVRIFADQGSYTQAVGKLVAAAGGSSKEAELEEAGVGVYRLETKTAYARVTLPYGTRAAILHECTHQFQYLSCTHNQIPRSGYYCEGLAQHFSMSRRVNGSLQIGVGLGLEYTDAPGNAIRGFRERHASSFQALACDTLFPKDMEAYGEAWGLVSFLIEKHRREFDKWSALLDAQADPRAGWSEASGGLNDEQLSRDYVEWLEQHQENWLVVGGDWADTGDGTVSATPWPGNMGILVPKRDGTYLSAIVRMRGSAWAGVGVNYYGGNGIYTVVTPNGEVWSAGRRVDRVHVDSQRSFHIEAWKSDGRVAVYIDRALVMSVPAQDAGKMALLVERGNADFSKMDAR